MIGKTIRYIVPDHESERLFSFFHLTSLGMHLESTEIPIRMETREAMIFQWNSANVKDKMGPLRASITFGVDITRQKEWKKKIEPRITA